MTVGPTRQERQRARLLHWSRIPERMKVSFSYKVAFIMVGDARTIKSVVAIRTSFERGFRSNVAVAPARFFNKRIAGLGRSGKATAD